jgi:cobalt/nickel transport system permease protein
VTLVLDRYADTGSVIHRRDARTKIVAFVLPVVVVASTPRGDLRPLLHYLALVAVLTLISRVPWSHLLWRCAAASPFIVMASLLLLWSGGWEQWRAALSVLGRAYLCVALIVLLTATSRLQDLLRGLRGLGAPAALAWMVNLMFRYIVLLQEQYGRMARARECRTVAPLRAGRMGLYARQFALLFIRSWERAERVHWAMLARGAGAALVLPSERRLQAGDVLFALATTAAFVASRILA